jgi:serine/threonine protein kinase
MAVSQSREEAMESSGGPQRTGEIEQRGLAFRRTTVLALSPRLAAPVIAAGGEGGPDLDAGTGRMIPADLGPEERLLLDHVDGSLSIARLARAAGLSEEAATQHLLSLYDRGVVVPVETAHVTIRGNSGEPFFRLGAYEVASRIGQGGMGSVYVCRRVGAVGFRRLFALKVVRQGTGQEQSAQRSFLREVRVGTLLDHPNTQSVLDVGMYKNQPFLVLQFIRGTSLEEISFGRRVPPDVLLAVLLDVLRGLQRAHEVADEEGKWLGLVHGDVSPPNIMVGIDGVSYLTDFGSARFSALGETHKPDSASLGKPAFMAPEQLLREPLDARTDLFAIGAVMWTALTGRELFAADTYEQIVDNVLHKEIEFPSVYGSPTCLDEVCLWALSRRREERPASAEEFARTLLRIGVTNGLVASPTAVGAYVRREVGEADIDRQRRIDTAFEGATAPPSPLAPPVVTVSTSPPPEKKFAQTMIVPGRQLPLGTAKLYLVTAKRRLRALLQGRHNTWVFLGIWVLLGVLAAGLTVALVRHRFKPVDAASAR